MTRPLSQLAQGLALEHLAGEPDPSVRGITADSRRVHRGDLFVAVRGHDLDGHRFVSAALEAGATVLVVEDASVVARAPGVSVFRTEDARLVLAGLARALYRHPDRDLVLVAVTGTNGKTTVCHLVRDLLEASGRRCGMLGTIRYVTGKRDLDAPLTTPGAEDLYAHLREMVVAGMDSCSMEASSHALDQRRLGAAEVDVAAFTNLTREHLEYHPNLEAYLAAKRLLLEHLRGPDRCKSTGRVVVNVDDPVLSAAPWPSHAVTVGTATGCRVRRLDARCHRDGTDLRLDVEGAELDLHAPLLGRYNVENLSVLVGIAVALDIDVVTLPERFERLRPVPGRLEPVDLPGGPLAVVDYAHTPDGLRSALRACRELTQGDVHLVFGCGGDRDRGKRPLMAVTALEGAARVYLTLDNPRHEAPAQIFADTEVGFAADPARALRIEDRQEAIAAALAAAEPADLVLVAGKGHEKYQIVGDTRHAWDDREALRRAWREIGGRR